MKLSARNIIKGKVISIKKGPVSTTITLQVAPGIEITSSITSEAAKELKLAKGKPAYAVIKASSVLLAVD